MELVFLEGWNEGYNTKLNAALPEFYSTKSLIQLGPWESGYYLGREMRLREEMYAPVSGVQAT